MKRDESRDVQLICDRYGLPSDEYSGHWYSLKVTPKMLPIAPGHSLARYVPFSDLETERAVLADVKREAAEIIAGLESRLAALQVAARHVWSCNELKFSSHALQHAIDDMDELLP